MGSSIRRATTADRARIVDCLVDAFTGDPFFRTLWPDDRGYRTAAREWFTADVRQLADHGAFWLTGDGTGVTCWVAPEADVAAPGEFDELQAIVDRTAGGRGAGAMAVLEAADDTAPDRPCWMCIYVAVRPGHQGRGLGGRLVAPRLAEADLASRPVHLASTNPRNLTFYERLGFRTLAVVQPVAALPPVWSLWREPGP
jgi:GNAT superfamily N-acetyltransferase